MKKIIVPVFFFSLNVFSQEPQTLSKLTFGVGIGVNHLFKDVDDYSLTTDKTHALKINETSRNNLVVSPVVIFRTTKIAFDKKSKKMVSCKYEYKTVVKTDSVLAPLSNWSKISLLLSLDLINVQSEKISFNKSIDGGIGIGYSFSPDLMLGVFYEIKSFRQLRPYIVENYLNKGIPNGIDTEIFNALDVNNSNLFYDKKIEGISVKLIFNINTL